MRDAGKSGRIGFAFWGGPVRGKGCSTASSIHVAGAGSLRGGEEKGRQRWAWEGKGSANRLRCKRGKGGV